MLITPSNGSTEEIGDSGNYTDTMLVATHNPHIAKVLKKSEYNLYPSGWCTWYGATKYQIPAYWGNAGDWLEAAKRDGFETGNIPQSGALVITNESIWGHVAYVEKVDNKNNVIVVSEMNYESFGVISERKININSSKVKGFIY